MILCYQTNEHRDLHNLPKAVFFSRVQLLFPSQTLISSLHHLMLEGWKLLMSKQFWGQNGTESKNEAHRKESTMCIYGIHCKGKAKQAVNQMQSTNARGTVPLLDIIAAEMNFA